MVLILFQMTASDVSIHPFRSKAQAAA